MAGITDRPFRTLCYEMGAGLTVSEMMSSNPQVWESDKSRLRMVHVDEPGIRTVQIAGSVPEEMAAAARINVESGAQIIDINMGCPAKKVNRKLAGSALLQYPDQVKSILETLSTTVFGQLSRKFPFRLSRMATLLTRLKPEPCSTIRGLMPL